MSGPPLPVAFEDDHVLIVVKPAGLLSVPPSGEAFYYLIRATNVCGIGAYGTDSDGSERESGACPAPPLH